MLYWPGSGIFKSGFGIFNSGLASSIFSFNMHKKVVIKIELNLEEKSFLL